MIAIYANTVQPSFKTLDFGNLRIHDLLMKYFLIFYFILTAVESVAEPSNNLSPGDRFRQTFEKSEKQFARWANETCASLTHCVALYAFTSHCAKNTLEQDPSSKSVKELIRLLSKSQNDALKLTLFCSDQEVTETRLKHSAEELTTRIQRCERAVLLDSELNVCKELIEGLHLRIGLMNRSMTIE